MALSLFVCRQMCPPGQLAECLVFACKACCLLARLVDTRRKEEHFIRNRKWGLFRGWPAGLQTGEEVGKMSVFERED